MRRIRGRNCRDFGLSHIQDSTTTMLSVRVRQLGLRTRCRSTTFFRQASNTSSSATGPTAVVLLNMGGPSTRDEVGDFLKRLFVSFLLDQLRLAHGLKSYILVRWRFGTSWTISKLHSIIHCTNEDTKNQEPIRSNRWRLTDQKVVRISSTRTLQDIGSYLSRNGTSFALRGLPLR